MHCRSTNAPGASYELFTSLEIRRELVMPFFKHCECDSFASRIPGSIQHFEIDAMKEICNPDRIFANSTQQHIVEQSQTILN